MWTLSVTATKCLRIQTNPDTCGRGLIIGRYLIKFTLRNLISAHVRKTVNAIGKRVENVLLIARLEEDKLALLWLRYG